jgi:uncharacterized protein
VQTLPKTIYLWLALLVASMLLGPRLASPRVKTASPVAAPLSGPAYESYLEAERLTRSYYAFPGRDLAPLSEALALYRALALTQTEPNLARKALILGNLRGLALDGAILKRLPEDERTLWRALYGRPAPPLPPDAEVKLRAMRLRFLDNQALLDLYSRQGDLQAAARADARLTEQAQRALSRVTPLVLVGTVLQVIGLGLLLFVLFVAVRREWHLLGRVPEPESAALGWGDLLDSFVFYLAAYRGAGLLVALVVRVLDLHPARIPLQVSLQAAMGALAVGYLVTKAKKQGAPLSELGWTRARLGANLLYGVAGYTVTLPLTIALGALARVLFRSSPASEPNAALPLLASTTALWELGLLFASVSLFAPLFEELFFRGALFTGLRRRFSGIPSILISAVIFAAVHPPQDWPPILGLGISFGIMRQLRQSVVPGIVAHFLQNTATFLLLSALFGE